MFKYNNQDHAMMMGQLAARNITEKVRYDVDKIGNDDLFFEGDYEQNSEALKIPSSSWNKKPFELNYF